MSNVLDEIVEGVEPWPGVVSVLPDSKKAVLLAIDIGTSGVRAALFDDRGREIDGTGIRNNHGLENLDYASLDAAYLFAQIGQTLDTLFTVLQDASLRIELIAISCFWHSLVGSDDAGNATTPVLGWADSRAGDAALKLRSEFDEASIHARTGCRFHASYWPAKLLRLRSEEPLVFNRTTRWLSFPDYLAQRFFGETATSVSMASGTGLFNQHTCEWDDELVRALEIKSETLPNIALPQQSLGPLESTYAARWPQLGEARLIPAFADGATNSIGSRCFSTEKVSLMIGTSGAMRVCFKGEPPNHIPPELWCYRANRERVLVGGALSDGGGLYSWLKDSLYFGEQAETLETELDLMPPDSHGLTVLPFWSGERSTGWNPRARGAIVGLTKQTLPSEILRAAMEAIAYRFGAIWNALEPFAPDAELIASGHALRSSPTWIQILADVLGRSIHVSETPEASMRGAALLALEAAGKIQSIEKFSESLARAGDLVFEPNMTNHARYQSGRGRQERIYKELFT